MDEIIYELKGLQSDSSLNIDLLHKNIENFGNDIQHGQGFCSVMVKLKE
jgi:hypothetical protein